MKVEIITIGDEILIGQIVDTNSAWMAVQLNNAGFSVEQITSVHDAEKQIIDALQSALTRADVVLFTGGLGPTNDDITKQTLCKYFDAKLIFDEKVLANITSLLRNRSRAMNDLTRSQAMVPDKAVVIPNLVGTAPVTWFENDAGQVVVSMPGVPYEMKEVMLQEIIPRLKKQFKLVSVIFHKTVLVHGYPESVLAQKIAGWEKSLPKNIRLAYLPSFNLVKLRLSAETGEKKIVQNQIARFVLELKKILGEAILAEEDIPLEALLGRLLQSKGRKLAVAESCTGGRIAHRIVAVPGSSAYFAGSVVAYENQAKVHMLGVDPIYIQKYGAVSREVVEQMVTGALALFHADIAVAVSGVAGPGGGTNEKPVGTVWIAVSSVEKMQTHTYCFNLGRELNIERAAQTALLMLIEAARDI